jgi:LmbE family N-acetylglucosaminyl deacetylase
VETYLVTATRGEHGRFGALGKGGDAVEVGRVREVELRAAAAVLGIREVSVLNYPDGAVDQGDATTAIRAVVSQIRRIQPDVVVTGSHNSVRDGASGAASGELATDTGPGA